MRANLRVGTNYQSRSGRNSVGCCTRVRVKRYFRVVLEAELRKVRVYCNNVCIARPGGMETLCVRPAKVGLCSTKGKGRFSEGICESRTSPEFGIPPRAAFSLS